MKLFLFFFVHIVLVLCWDDLIPLSDEFSNSSTLSDWKRVVYEEQWFLSGTSVYADQLQVLNIDTTSSGGLYARPYSCAWYGDMRGPLIYKEVQEDFIATARVTAVGLSSTVPNRLYSLAGILVRAPKNITGATWLAGNENYVFLSLGSANNVSTNQFEVKTTVDSNSVLEIQDTPNTSSATIRIARIGIYIICLYQLDNSDTWTIHRKYSRPDFPAILQVGMTMYTNWEALSSYYPSDQYQYNQMVINSQPDLAATYDYFRYCRPELPPALQEVDLTTVSDFTLLSFLGSTACNITGGVLPSPSPSPNDQDSFASHKMVSLFLLFISLFVFF